VEPEVAAELASGALVRVLPDWSGPTLSVDVLMPARTRQPAKIRMAVEALRGYLDQAARRSAGVEAANPAVVGLSDGLGFAMVPGRRPTRRRVR
jgi:hypothetical protein